MMKHFIGGVKASSLERKMTEEDVADLIMLVLLDEYRGFQWHPLDGRPEKSIGPTTLPSIITSRMITMRVLWMTVRCIFDREPQ